MQVLAEVVTDNIYRKGTDSNFFPSVLNASHWQTNLLYEDFRSEIKGTDLINFWESCFTRGNYL